jgi:hypothetical protein
MKMKSEDLISASITRQVTVFKLPWNDIRKSNNRKEKDDEKDRSHNKDI